MNDTMQDRLEAIAAQLTRAEELQHKDPEASALLRAIALEWLDSLKNAV